MPSFENSCFEAAKRFVHTAVVIDDEAGYFDVEMKRSLPPPTTAPPTGLTSSIGPEPSAADIGCIPDESEWDHYFDIYAVVNGFAELKINCSVQRPDFGSEPEKNDKLKNWALNCAERADITIIDWRLFKGDLHLAEDIIIDLLRKDQEVGGKIRLLCVYTAQPNPENILNDIKRRIKDDLDLSIVDGRSDLACTVDEKIRIIVLNKTESRISGNNCKVVSFEELPEAVLEEFSVLVEGLIPCAVLHSIAAVREQTYSLLALMNKSLDGAFCAHRALIPDTEDSIDFVLALISQELSTKVMCDSSARNALSTKSLKDWYKKKPLPENQYPLEKSVLWECVENGGTDLNCIRTKRAEGWLRKKEKSKNNLQNKQGAEISIEDAKEFIKKGLFHEIKNCSPPSIKRSEKFAELFYTKSKDCEKACNELARLFCISNDESDVRRGFNVGLFLTLGSVLQVKVRNNDNEYWLCLQPPCDSVRLEGKTEMLFLQLYKGNKENSDLIIKLHDESYQPLCVKPPKKKARLKTHGFAPNNTTRRVSVNNLAGKHNGKFKWVAQLRPEKAHAIAQKVLANASRTGLDEFEILRRKGSQF